MVSTRSSRTSSRAGRNQSPVDINMGDTMDKKEETVEKDEGAEVTTPADKKEEDTGTAPEEKKDVNCKKCLQEGKPSKAFHKKTNQVRFNEVVETREVETEYDKPERIFKYMQGFVKRVIICSVFILLCKAIWPRLQPMVWPETPTKVGTPSPSLSLLTANKYLIQEGKLYILNDRSFRGHVSRGDHFVMMMAPW